MYWGRVYTPCTSCSYECNSAFGFIPFNSRLLIDCSTARAGSNSQSESFHCRYSCGFVDDVGEVSWLTCTWWQSLRYEQGGAWPQYIYQTFELVQYNMWDSGTTEPWYTLLGLMYTSSPLKFRMFSKCSWTHFPTSNSPYHCNVLNLYLTKIQGHDAIIAVQKMDSKFDEKLKDLLTIFHMSFKTLATGILSF